MKNYLVIYEQVYDVVNIFDIITEDCLNEYMDLFYEHEINKSLDDIRTIHFVNEPQVKLNYDGFGGSVSWNIKADLKDLNDWSAKYESLKDIYLSMNTIDREKCYPKTTYITFGFDFTKFDDINNFKNLYKNN